MATSTEQRHSAAEGLQTVPPEEVLQRLFQAQTGSARALEPAFPALTQAAELGAAALRGTGRLAYAGAGSSGLMALADCLELSGTFGIAPARTPMLLAGGSASLLHLEGGPEDDVALAEGEMHGLRLGPGDVVICVSASGATPFTLAVARGAKAAGAAVVGIANVADSPLLALADVPVLLDTGPEVVAGSTRMAAGTAQKIALNLLSTVIAVRLGHVHEGYMVNVRADNAKLRDRAARIVAAIARVDEATAGAALERTGGAVKPAVLVAAGAMPEAAEALLESHDGHLGPALATLGKP
jgi:N-acetylmuramic acid 6-phosphate etherase